MRVLCMLQSHIYLQQALVYTKINKYRMLFVLFMYIAYRYIYVCRRRKFVFCSSCIMYTKLYVEMENITARRRATPPRRGFGFIFPRNLIFNYFSYIALLFENRYVRYFSCLTDL